MSIKCIIQCYGEAAGHVLREAGGHLADLHPAGPLLVGGDDHGLGAVPGGQRGD